MLSKWNSVSFEISNINQVDSFYKNVNEFFRTHQQYSIQAMAPGVWGISAAIHNLGPLAMEWMEFTIQTEDL